MWDTIFALGGRLESLSAAGETEGLEDVGQALIDAVQAAGYCEEAITYLGRSAINWLKHQRVDEAVSLLGVGIRLGVNAYQPDEDDSSPESDATLRPLMSAVMFGVIAARLSESDEEAVCEAVVSQLAATSGKLSELVRPLLQIAREAQASDEM